MPTPALASSVANAAAAAAWDGGPAWDPVKTAMRTTRNLTWQGAHPDRRLDDVRPGPPPLGPRGGGRVVPAPRRGERPRGAAAAPGGVVAPRRHLGNAGRGAARGGAG